MLSRLASVALLNSSFPSFALFMRGIILHLICSPSFSCRPLFLLPFGSGLASLCCYRISLSCGVSY